MPSDCPSASTVEADAAAARLSSPRWKKPSSGPLPRTGDGDHGFNRSPRGPPSSRSELKRRLRASAEAAGLALAAAEAARRSHASVRADGGLDDVQRLGPAGVRVDVGNGTVQRLWSDADEVTLLAAAFRERSCRAPRRPDAGALFNSIKGSISPDIDDDMDGEEAGEQDADEGRLVVDDGESDAGDRGLATERTSKPAPLPQLVALTPSEGPSASAMDVDVVPTLPSSSRSTKRSFHHQPSVEDDHPGRVPSPRRLGTSADIAALAHAAAEAARGSDGMAAHVDGKQDDVQSHGTAGVRADVVDGTAHRLELGDHGAARDSHTVWSDADEITLLNATVAFRERTGRVPRVRDAGALLRSIWGSVSPHIDEAMASYKMRHLRSMFRHEALGESATAHDHRVHDLSSKVWGVVARDEGALMPVATEMLGEFWKVNERAMAGLPLEKGLSLLGKREATLIETKWRQQLDEEMQTQMQRHDLAKEICGLLNDTILDLGP